MSDAPELTIAEHLSPWPFAITLERLDHAMMDFGMTIFARIDHAANARAIGSSMPPSTVLIYGKAAGGTPIMLASPRAALDLPLHVLVRAETDGRAFVCFRPIVPLLQASGVDPSLAARLLPAQALLLKALEP